MPADVKERINEAIQLHQSGNLVEAEKKYLEIIQEFPENANALNLLGILQLQKRQIPDAISNLKKASELIPSAYLLGNLGRAYAEDKNFTEAIICYKKALALDEKDFESWFNLGIAYRNINQYENSLKAYERALLINPKHVSLHFNLGNLYDLMNDTQKAIEYYEKALEYNTDPDDIDILYFLSISYIKAKNFKKGLPLHEYRPSRPFAIFCQESTYPEQMKGKPFWGGSDMKDKTIFVYYESALGDTIMYARYLPLLKDKFKKVLFKPQVCFIDLFRENNYGAEIVDNRMLPSELVFDVHMPLMTIPFVLNHFKEEDIPFPEGYIKANAEKVKEYKEKYFNNNKYKIGIKWMGNLDNDHSRIITIESFFKLFDIPNTQFYSVQKGDGEEELNKIPKEYNVIDLADTFNNFSDTAAAIENMDLVICNDTSIAHLAGAMGKPCWILLPFVQNWRWHTDISYSPWYNSVKLFKQKELGNWDEVFDNVKKELNKLI